MWSVIRGSLYGLATALSFSVSPLFIRVGMNEGHSAQIALAVGLVAAAVTYFFILLIRDRDALTLPTVTTIGPFSWEVAAALVIVAGTWLRYEAMDRIPLAVVSAVGRVNLLVILLIARREITRRVWVGGFLIIVGTVILSV